MSRNILDLHVLQTVPPSNLNRDDTGSPKSAVYGGVKRARVSSQAWKRAVRKQFMASVPLDAVGVRTKRVVDELTDVLAARGLDPGSAAKTAEQLLAAAGLKLAKSKRADRSGRVDQGAETEFLFFVSPRQLEALADLADQDLKAADVKKRAKEALRTGNSIDIALFGRMVATPEGLNVDASCQVAHALSVHRAETEYDYFTAVDDRKAEAEEEDAGAGMIGTIEFNSATLYRYATIDLDLLAENLGGGPDAAEAAVGFVRAFITSMPTGKQNTFANRTLPDLVLVDLRSDQPMNLVGAFEVPVQSAGGYAALAAERLATHRRRLQEAFGLAPSDLWTVGVVDPGDDLPTAAALPDVLAALREALDARLASS
jgi:CRISPR system Cascade subunit CasC